MIALNGLEHGAATTGKDPLGKLRQVECFILSNRAVTVIVYRKSCRV